MEMLYVRVENTEVIVYVSQADPELKVSQSGIFQNMDGRERSEEKNDAYSAL
jgi:hypothetical protein